MKRARNQVGRPSFLRHTNALTLLHLLRESGTCSRADLVRASGLSAPTVTKIVADLAGANLIKPLGEGESSGGRPPNMLSFKADRGCILGVQITAHSLTFLVVDLSGTPLEITHLSLAGTQTTPEAICQKIGEEIRHLLARHKKARKQLLALVVAVPAITNVDEGTVVSISTLENWRNVPLRSMLGNIVDCLVIVENDTNLGAAGERFKGAAHSEDDFVLINIGANVSAGILLHGHIHHGSQWSAGEIGYLRLPSISGKPPSLYEFGDLEYFLSPAGIRNSWHGTAMHRKEAAPPADTTAALQIFDKATSGDARALTLLEERAEIVSDIIVNLSLILNPALILLGGEIGSHPALLRSVQKHLDRCEFAVTRVAAAALGPEAVVWGAIAIGLDAIPLVLLPHPTA